MSSHDISVKFSASGERTLLATLARVRTTAARISTPMVADLAKLRQVAAEFGKIGVASAGIGAVGAAAFVGSLSKARDVAADIAEQLAGIENTARGLGSTDASALGGFAFAARAAGWEGLEDVIGIGGAMREAAIAVREGDEDIIKAFGDLGIRYEDLFTFDADSRSFSGPLRSADEMLRNVAERLNDIKDAAGDVSIDESLIKILGATDAAKMQSLAEISAQTIADRIDMWNALMSNPTQDDYSAARAFRSSLHANEVAIDGMKLSFSRSLFPALIEANNQFAQFAIDNQERMGALGEAFANFVGDVEPLLLRLADVALEVAAGGEFDDTPMAAFMSRLVELAASLKDGLIDVLDYLSTGQTDVAWLNGIIDLFKAFSQGLKDIFSTLSDFNALIRDDIAPMVDALTSSVSALLDMLGVESSGGQLAVVSGLLLFSNTLTKALGLVGKLIFQIGKLGYAAAAATLTTSGASAAAGGAAAGGGAVAKAAALSAGTGAAVATGAGLALLGGSAWAVKSTEDMAEATDKAAARAKELAKTHGEVYAAAYLRAFVDQEPAAHSGFSALNWLGEKLGITDFAGTKDQLDAIIARGDASDAVAGAAAAYRDFAWPVEQGDQLEVSAGITVTGVELSSAAQSALDQVQASMRIEAAASSLANMTRVPELQYSAPPAEAAPSSQQTPILIQIGTSEPIGGLSADSTNVVRELSRVAYQASRARS